MQDASNEIKKEIKDSASKLKDDIENRCMLLFY